MRFHATNDKAPGAKRLSLYRRAWLHWGSDEFGGAHSVSAEVTFRGSYRGGIGFEVRFDGPSAETPIDAAVFLGPLSVFAGTSMGSTLNRWLRVRPGHSREIGVQLSGSDGAVSRLAYTTFQWSLWTDPEHQVRPSKYVREQGGLSRWYCMRRGYTHPIGRVLDIALGRTAYTTEDVAEVDAVAHLQDGPYPLTLTLRRSRWQRPRSPRGITRVAVEYEVVPVAEGGPGSCPTGKESWGVDNGLVSASTRELSAAEAADPAPWAPLAVGAFTERVLAQRARYGWRQAVAASLVDSEVTIEIDPPEAALGNLGLLLGVDGCVASCA
jgi:hypothetical protein